MSPVLLVTGASSGIGLETAVAAARAGHTAVATVRDTRRADALRAAAAEAGVAVDVRRLDVTDDASIHACLAGVIADHGRLDVLVNNAGTANTFATIETCPMETYRANIEVNFLGVVATTRAALPHLRTSRGRIVTIGSTRGLIGQPFNEAYSAAKFAVEGFMESLAPVAAAMGVTAVIVAPGPVLGTSFGANAGVTRESLLAQAGPYAGVLERYLDWVARGKWPGAQPAREIADVIVKTLADPDPPFRIMTGAWGDAYARHKLVDPDGRAVREMTRSWLAPPVLDLHRRALEGSVEVVRAIRDDQWDAPTPCAGWTVRDLVTHMIRENRGFAAAAGGETADRSAWSCAVGPDPRADYADSAGRVVAAFAGEGALDREVWLPLIDDTITIPASRAIGFHLLDYLVHGWDVAVATGRPPPVRDGADDDVVAAVREIARRDAPDGPRRHRPGASFAPALPPAATATAFERLLAFLGRDPGWRPGPEVAR